MKSKKIISQQSRLIASIQVYVIIHLWFEAPSIIQFSKENERNRDVHFLKHQHGTLLLLFVHDLCEIWHDLCKFDMIYVKSDTRSNFTWFRDWFKLNLELYLVFWQEKFQVIPLPKNTAKGAKRSIFLPKDSLNDDNPPDF